MLTGKKVLVLGLARSGNAAVKLLLKLNADITVNVYDPIEKVKEYDEYKAKGIRMICGGHPAELFEEDWDFVVKNPGIKYRLPFILRLKERGIPVYTEIEFGYQVAKPQHYIAVTGTNGKTTTVTLMHKILEANYGKAYLGGNIGTPYCDIILENNLLEDEGNYVVLEMSNFQLLDVDQFKPEVSTIINLTPDHLDYMASLDEYYASKTNIYRKTDKSDVYVLNLDDPVLAEYIERYPLPCNVVTQSLDKEADCEIKDHTIYYKDEAIMNLDEIKVVGKHNVQNYMIAIAACKEANASTKVIHDVLAEFAGVEHRIEFVREINGVRVYNDSKATNTDAAIIALKAFDQPVILLMGGFEKGLDLAEMSTYNDKISTLVTFGVAGPRFAKDMKHPNTIECKNLKEATLKALEIAHEGDVVLLSPSTSSFDEFKGYEERGRVFKDIVNGVE